MEMGALPEGNSERRACAQSVWGAEGRPGGQSLWREVGSEWTQVMIGFQVQGKVLRFLFQVRLEAIGDVEMAWRVLLLSVY